MSTGTDPGTNIALTVVGCADTGLSIWHASLCLVACSEMMMNAFFVICSQINEVKDLINPDSTER